MVPFTRLPRLVVDALLVEHRSNALHDPAAHLVVHDQRVDDAAAVGDRPMAEELDEAGGRYRVRDRSRARRGPCNSSRAFATWLRVTENCTSVSGGSVSWRKYPIFADFGQARDLRARARVDDLPAHDVEIVGRRLGDRAGDGEDIAHERTRRLERRLPTDGDPAGRPGAAAVCRDRAVPRNHVDVAYPTPTVSAMICARECSVPWPWSVIEVTQRRTPDGSSRRVQPSCTEMAAPVGP